MNKTLFWISFYFGQNVILHPDTGKWYLDGYFDGQVVCGKHLPAPDDDSMLYPIEEIQFVLKQFNRTLLNRYLDFLPFLKLKSEQGYWVFETSGFKQVIFEK